MSDPGSDSSPTLESTTKELGDDFILQGKENESETNSGEELK